VTASRASGREALLRPIVSGNQVYVVACGRKDDAGAAFLEVLRVPLDGSRVRTVNSTTVHASAADSMTMNWWWENFIGGLDLGAGQAFVGTGDGIYCFPLDGGKPRVIAEADGLPVPGVETLAYFEGKLYAALKGGYFIAYDLGSKRCQVLASSRRKEKHSPLDDSSVFVAPYLVVDAERQRLLFLAKWVKDPDKKKTGLWELNVRDGTFVLRQALPWFSLWGSRIYDGHILLSWNTSTLADYDLTRDSIQYLWNAPADSTPQRAKVAFSYYKAEPPFLYTRHLFKPGRIWTGDPLGWIDGGTGAQVLFPALVEQNALAASATPAGCLEFVDEGRRLLVGNGLGLWVAELRPEAVSKPWPSISRGSKQNGQP
jgi:hypothetical protein